MKTTLIAAIAIAALSLPGFAGVSMRADSKKVVLPPEPECFKAGEIQLDVFGSYNVSSRGDGWGGGLGLGYFVTRNLGFDVEGNAWAAHEGIVNMNANIIYRFPMHAGNHCFAPYLFCGGGSITGGAICVPTRGSLMGHERDGGMFSSVRGEGHIGGGIEFRCTEKIGIFADGRHGWGDSLSFTTWRLGLRMIF